ncbi:MAG: antibiotic biosynthesis monooxygenase [Rhodospirillales bacterium]|nr:MAG: antibiotic biosynthesis monooxygenase [Rhodospirillales bacterium]
MIGVWIEYRARPGRREECLAALRRNCAETLRDDGCLRMELGTPATGDGATIVLSELWRDEAALAAHRARPGHDAGHAAVDALVESRRVVRYDLA